MLAWLWAIREKYDFVGGIRCLPIITVARTAAMTSPNSSRFNDDPITVCPKCSQEQVRKVYSAVPIEFKGHGFYRTDKSGK